MFRTIALLLSTTLASAVFVGSASATPAPPPGHPRTCVGCWIPGDQ